MWTLNNIRIFVDESKEGVGQILPRLQPLSGGTVVQVFGYESPIRNLGCWVVGDVDLSAIKDLVTTGVAYELVSPEGSLGDFYVKTVGISRVHCICQSLRTDLEEDAPLYRVEVELYE